MTEDEDDDDDDAAKFLLNMIQPRALVETQPKRGGRRRWLMKKFRNWIRGFVFRFMANYLRAPRCAVEFP